MGMFQIALNNTVHEATRKTPFFINFGREMVLKGTEYRKLSKIIRPRIYICGALANLRTFHVISNPKKENKLFG